MPGNALSYLAGLFDGEGSVEARYNARRNRSADITMRLRIFNTDQMVMVWLAEHFGGRVTEQNRKYGRKLYIWSLAYRENEQLVRQLADECVIKREQLLCMLELGATLYQRGRHPISLETQVKRLGLIQDIRDDKWKVS